jgi:hypothetical protein
MRTPDTCGKQCALQPSIQHSVNEGPLTANLLEYQYFSSFQLNFFHIIALSHNADFSTAILNA